MRKIWRRILMTALAPVLLVGLLHADVPQFAKAIARTEGFYVANSKAARYHNPGNLRAHGRYMHYRTNRAGWAALYQQLFKIRDGESRVYNVDMTLAQFGNVYACGHRIWAKNVAAILHIELSSKIAEILDIPLEPVRELNEEDEMKIETTVTFGPPAIIPMQEMQVGDIGVIDRGSFVGETIIRNHAGWFSIEGDRFWDENHFVTSRHPLLSLVRILQPGDTLNIKRTA